jgi:hypothetical protein
MTSTSKVWRNLLQTDMYGILLENKVCNNVTSHCRQVSLAVEGRSA